VGCIKSVTAIEGNDKIQAKFKKFMNLDSSLNLDQDLSKGIVRGIGSGGVWSITDAKGNNIDVAVQALVKASNKEAGVVSDLDTSNFNIWALQVNLTPIRELRGTFLPRHYEVIDHPRTNSLSRAGGRLSEEKNRNCVAAEEEICYERVDFTGPQKWEVAINFPNKFTGWFHGRLSGPEVVYTSNPDGSVDLKITGTATSIPGIQERKAPGTWGKKLEEYVLSLGTCQPGKSACVGSDGGYIEVGPVAREEYVFTLANLLLETVEDKSTFTDKVWSFGTGFGVASPEVSKCIIDHPSLSAIVSTNALIYSSGPPTFSRQQQTLEYRVMSPHLDELSRENLGTYDLVLDKKVARCIYGFSDAPINASIEVTSEDGVSKVVSTSIRETADWMYFSANGFRYSNPTIRVKLEQERSTSIERASDPKSGSASEETSIKSKKATSIRCSKDGKTKKIAGTNPTCPKGFKRVRTR
jgi:hypothetical protein